MHKILSVRFLLKFSHFFFSCYGSRCIFSFGIGKFAFSVPLCGLQWLGIGSPAGNRAQIQTHNWSGVSNNPCGNAKM